MKKSKGYLWALALCTLLILSGCSGSDSDDIATISGTASSGAPVVGTISLKDADGTVLGPVDIESDGSFSFNVTGYTAPFVLRATVTASGANLYSYALNSGQTNVNPLTTLIVASAAGEEDPATVYDDLTEITDGAIAAAAEAVRTVLANLFTAFGVDADFDPLSDDCTVNHVGIDALFDAVIIEINTGTGAVEVKALDDTVLVSTTTDTIDTATAVTLSDASDAASQISWVGTYNYCELFLDTPSGGNSATAAAGHITFEADGTWVAVVDASSSNDDIGETNSGTYSIDSTGRILVNGSEYGVVTPDGEVMVIPDLDASEGKDVGLTILCKRDTALALSDIDGMYEVISLYRDTPSAGSGASADVQAITFNGDGTYGATGTYSVDALGRFTADGSEDYGMVAMGGDVIVLPDYDSTEGDDLGISIMIKTSTAAGWDVSDIDGNYNFAEIFADVTVTDGSMEDAVNTAGGVLSFDGAGAFSGTITCSSADEADPFSGTYTAPTGFDGETLNCMLVEDSFGIFSENGYLFVVPDDDTTEGSDVGMTLGVQTW